MRSLLVSASSARRAEVFTPSPLLWVFSMMEQARNTKAGTVSCFSCLGISTSVQYCVSSLITSWKGKTVGSSGYRREDEKNRRAKKAAQSLCKAIGHRTADPFIRKTNCRVHLSDAIDPFPLRNVASLICVYIWNYCDLQTVDRYFCRTEPSSILSLFGLLLKSEFRRASFNFSMKILSIWY